MQCGFPVDGTIADFTLYSAPVRNDNTYVLTCSRGHTSTTVSQECKFEVLFEIAINAICDGYYREAVASATASLERFYEFSVKVICKHSDIDVVEMEKSWSLIKNQSERQLGAYVFCYSLQFKACPEVLSQSWVSFRNSVVHKGEIPEREKCIEYAEEVLRLIRQIMVRLKKDMPKSVGVISLQDFHTAQVKLGDSHPRGTMAGGTILSVAAADDLAIPSIREKIERIEKRKYRG